MLLLVSAVSLFGLKAYSDAAAKDIVHRKEVIAKREDADKILIARLVEARLKREATERKQTAQTITAAITGQVDAGVQIIQLPRDVKTKTCNHSKQHDDPSREDVLVNKQHCLKPLDYIPSDLVSGDGVTLTRSAYDAYHSMRSAAAGAGVTLTPTSSYRSYELQITSYSDWYRTLGTVAEANEVSALPGYSEHQLGLAVDLRSGGCALDCFRATSAYRWLQMHAHEYGYIERYPSGQAMITGYQPESWHWRYVGIETATAMRQQNVTTLEKYWSMSGGNY